jgi:hypothetical protein
VTLQQRRVLLERLRAEVADVVEDVEATAATIRAVAERSQPLSPAEELAMRLIQDQQRVQQLELVRISAEYESLVLRSRATATANSRAA